MRQKGQRHAPQTDKIWFNRFIRIQKTGGISYAERVWFVFYVEGTLYTILFFPLTAETP